MLVDQQGLEYKSADNDDDRNSNIILKYCFVRINKSLEIAPEQQEQQQQQQQTPAPNIIEVVGGLLEFLRETLPGIGISTFEKQVEELEMMDLTLPQTGKRCVGVDGGVMDEKRARELLNLL